MFKDKKKGLVIAKDSKEATWYKIAQGIKDEIKLMQLRNDRAKKDLKLSAREIEKRFKNGAKAIIKQNNLVIKVQKEILKFVESKIE